MEDKNDETNRPSVNVQDDITPISREKIENVNSFNWNNLKLSDLYQQKSILEKRLFSARQLHNQNMVEQLERGISHIEAVIKSKSTGEIPFI